MPENAQQYLASPSLQSIVLLVMTPRIHLVRHGQGFHQLEPLQEHRQIPDPSLTDLGVQRCDGFSQHFPDYIHIDLVCASPMRRTIQTAMHCFQDRIPQTPTQQIILLPLAQENTAEPCDVGSDTASIKQEFGDLVDTGRVDAAWNSKQGVYAPTPEALIARARQLRRWLRERPEREIVVVGHGAFFDYVIGSIGEDGNLLGRLLTDISVENACLLTTRCR